MRFAWSGVVSNIKTAIIHSMLKKTITIGAMGARLLYGHCQIYHLHSKSMGSGCQITDAAVGIGCVRHASIRQKHLPQMYYISIAPFAGQI